MTSRKWNKKKVLITGGSAGLGRSLALKISQLGAKVAVVARHAEALQSLYTEDEKIEVIRGDVSDKNQIHRIYAEAIEKIGDVDVLFNNASSLGPAPLRLLIDTECEDFSLALETNLFAAFRLSKLVLPAMLLNGGGLIVNISSDAAIQDYPKWGAYSISKSALDHLTRIFEAELEGRGVRFMAVDPGDMATALHQSALPDADFTQLHSPEESARLLIALIDSGEFSAAHRGVR